MSKAEELTAWLAGHVAERSATFNSIKHDLEYAMGQLIQGQTCDGGLRVCRDRSQRALDALGRVQERLQEMS